MAQLEDYFDKQSELPNEVTRALRLIKELDEKVQTQAEQIEALKPEGKKELITKLYDENINLTQEKIQIADKLYQMVDKAVQDLDDDLKRFEDNIKNSMAPDHKRRFLLLSKYQKEKRKKINLEIEQCKEIFQSTAASEPLYCHCQKPSFGQMIMCDNQLCQKEWFHLECVRLKDFPSQNTQWYCSGDCRREGRNRLKR